MNGIFLINKKSGCTSRDCVNEISKKFHEKKVGHTGTLDPLAEGVLIVCIGKATKLVDMLTSDDKEYKALVCLGTKTDTLDIEGKVIDEKEVNLTDDEIIQAINSMRGKYLQEVPKYSACKVNGKKLYEYARENIDIQLPKREVEIFDINLLGNITRKENKIYFEIECKVSKGTYIRSLIRDIADKLNTIGIMCKLTRIKQGNYDISMTKDISSINENDLIPVYDTLNIPKIIVDDDLKKDILNGKIIKNMYSSEHVAFVTDDKLVLAIYKTYLKDENYLKPEVVFGGI